MLVLIGASASGKTEIAKLLIHHYKFEKMITYTTRPMRRKEVNHVDYHFVTESDFLNKKSQEFFLESTFYNGYHYGTAFKDATAYRVVIVDIPGANAIYKKLKASVVIMYISTPKDLRKFRMELRGDAVKDIDKRLHTDKHYFKQSLVDHIDAVIDNGEQNLEDIAEYIAGYYKDKLSR